MNFRETGPMPGDIRRFINSSIPSVPFLEALLLMHGAPDTVWRGIDIAQRLYIAEPAGQGLLERLAASHLVQADKEDPAGYRYHPASAALQAMVDRLAATYATHLIEVTGLIHAKSQSKVQLFADAFKLRKDS